MKINIDYLKNNISISNINALFKEEKIEDVKLEEGILKSFLDKNIKERANKLYRLIEKEKLEIITIEDKKYPIKQDCPFCIVVSKGFRHNLNKRMVNIYYNSYFSKPAEVIIKYNYEIIKSLGLEVMSKYEKINSIKTGYLEKYLNSSNKDNYLFTLEDCIFFVNDNTDEILFCEAIVIPEARYENKIVSKVDYMLEKSKPILIFPNSIFNKNGYFSNYLIKQGADIILNKYDLLFILKPLSCWLFFRICYIILIEERGDINGG